MDPAESDRQLIERILNDSAKAPHSHGGFRLQTAFDRDQNHDLILRVGWEGVRRIHGCLVHVDLIDGKFWIQRDEMEFSTITGFIIIAGSLRARISVMRRSRFQHVLGGMVR